VKHTCGGQYKKLIKAQAEQLLSHTFDCPVQLGNGTAITSRSHIHRFDVIDGPPNLTKSIIAKQTRDIQNHTFEPSGYPSQSWLLFNDWAGLQFLQQVVPANSLSPRFFAGDRKQGILISEDVHPSRMLSLYLQEHNPLAAENALVKFASSLGKMHARTIGKQQEFDGIRDSLASRLDTWGWVPPWLRQESTFANFLNMMDSSTRERGFDSYFWMTSVFKQATSILDVTPVSGAEKDLVSLISSLSNPGPFLTFTHGDLCLENCLVSDTALKFVDFEIGAYRHALIDGVYARMPFPTCAWMQHTIPEPMVQRMEAVYRSELIKGCSAAADDTLFHYAIVEACAYWVLLLCQFNVISQFSKKDAKQDSVLMPQRVLLRFERFARMTQEFNYLEALGATFQLMAVKLRTLWSIEANSILPLYPAFER